MLDIAISSRKRRTIDVLRAKVPGTWTYSGGYVWSRKEGGHACWTGSISFDGDLVGGSGNSSLHFYPGDGSMAVRVLP